jgi:HAD superfamily hydrolase (TIGR01509 family)
MNIKAILYDLDGLLIDSERAHFQALEDLLSGYGISTPQEWFLPMIGMDNEESASFIIKETGLSLTTDELNDLRFENVIRLLPQIGEQKDGLTELLDNCIQHDIKIAVASNSPLKYVLTALEALAIRDKFEVVCTAYDVANAKPAPDVYLEAARRLAVEPGDCMGVEDSLLGLEAVISAGMTSVAIPNPYLSTSDFSHANHIFSSLKAFNEMLPELIEKRLVSKL